MDENITYERGDLIFVDNPLKFPHGHVSCGNHPAVVVQNDKANEHSSNLVVAYLTSQLKRLELPTHVVLQHYEGLRPSMIQTEQLATIDKGDVLGYINHLRPEDMIRMDQALMASLGLEVQYGG